LRDRAYISEATTWVSIWYFIVTAGGLMPTFLISLFTDKWTAPPFNYRTKGTGIILLHVIPATLWLIGSILQVFFTTLDKPSWELAQGPNGAFLVHRVFGGSLMNTIFIVFEVSAIYSLVSNLSPLGKHVQLMEWLLAIGTFIYFTTGLFFIYLQDPYYHTGHKICMIMTMITASGPGFFRVLRHTRELATGRLFSPALFTEYDDVPKNRHQWRNFKNVESTYFCLAFIGTDLFAALVFSRMGLLHGSEWSWLCQLFVMFPVLAVVGSILVRIVLAKETYEDFHFTFAIDYIFPVLKDDLAANYQLAE